MAENSPRLTFRELFQQYDQEEPEYVPLTNDLLFHKVFTGNREALACLLCSLLDLKREEVQSVEVLSPAQYGEAANSRQTILDLRVRLNENRFILVEVQVKRFPAWTNRTLVYTCRQIAEQVKGKDFDYDSLPQVVQISIMCHTLFPDHKRFYTEYSLKDETGYEFSDRMKFLVMDLTAIEMATEKDRKQGLVEWAKAFSAETWDEVEKVDTPGIQEVKEYMTFIMSQPTERDRIIERQFAIWDHNTLVKDAERRGLQQGIEKGEKLGIEKGEKLGEQRANAIRDEVDKERVRRMRLKGMDPEAIAGLMALSIETVHQWLEE